MTSGNCLPRLNWIQHLMRWPRWAGFYYDDLLASFDALKALPVRTLPYPAVAFSGYCIGLLLLLRLAKSQSVCSWLFALLAKIPASYRQAQGATLASVVLPLRLASLSARIPQGLLPAACQRMKLSTSSRWATFLLGGSDGCPNNRHGAARTQGLFGTVSLNQTSFVDAAS